MCIKIKGVDADNGLNVTRFFIFFEPVDLLLTAQALATANQLITNILINLHLADNP
jgi:hypothetical protein